jgi:hypothetical protein
LSPLDPSPDLLIELIEGAPQGAIGRREIEEDGRES